MGVVLLGDNTSQRSKHNNTVLSRFVPRPTRCWVGAKWRASSQTSWPMCGERRGLPGRRLTPVLDVLSLLLSRQLQFPWRWLDPDPDHRAAFLGRCQTHPRPIRGKIAGCTTPTYSRQASESRGGIQLVYDSWRSRYLVLGSSWNNTV